MTRRTFLPATALPMAALAQSNDAKPAEQPMPRKGHLKQSVCRWCYSKTPIEELAREAKRLGIQSIDLIDVKEWPVARQHGLTPTMISAGTTIPDGFNRKENHDGIEQRFKEAVTRAAENSVPSVIVFSGNRRGMSDQEGLANCAEGLRRMMPFAEQKGVLVCMELLNSKVDHKDYMCDRTPWGADLVQKVGSPRFRLLYDIYHMQIMEGDVIRTVRTHWDSIGHFHTGGVPGRNEIDMSQELNYRRIAEAIVEKGYQGYFAHEFIPKRDPLKSLAEAVDLCDV